MRYYIYISFLILLFTVLSTSVYAQEEIRAREIIDQRIEELSAKTDMEFDFSELYDHFLFLYENPININTASVEELRSLLFLNENQIIVLIEERDKRKGFQTIYELKDLDGFYINLVLDIKPFITFEITNKKQKISLSNMLKYGKNQVIVRYGRVLEEQEGYTPISEEELEKYPNRRYLGSKDKLYLRYRYHYSDKISFGILGDKDAGEEFFKGSNKQGFDFYSAHLFIKNQGRIKALALGDYHLEFGQGLTLWSSLAFGKSATSINLQRHSRGLRANTSANEVLFFRGAAATIGITKNIELTGFYSNKGLDASLNIKDTVNSDELVFASIQESGMHRTPSEVEKKNAINEQIFGANIQYKDKGFKIGITSYATIYDTEFYKDIKPYQYYDFQGKENINTGIDASYATRYFSVFGEAAISKNKGKALIIGSLFNLHPRLNFTVLYRNYQKDYQGLYAIALAEGGKSQNEEGIYFGSHLHLGSKNDILIYYDLFKFPWLKYRVNTPSYGSEFSFQYMRNISRKANYYVRYKYEEKLLNSSEEETVLQNVSTVIRSNLRFHFSYTVSKSISLESRINLSTYHHEPKLQSNGYLLFQDIKYKLPSIPMNFTLRYAIFNTADYDTRIYAYEHNVLYKFSVPAYTYQGQRYYILMKYDISKNFSFWFHYSQTFYTKRKTIGSGLEEIDGNTRSDFTTQLIWKF